MLVSLLLTAFITAVSKRLTIFYEVGALFQFDVINSGDAAVSTTEMALLLCLFCLFCRTAHNIY
jgi:hypothetical protein